MDINAKFAAINQAIHELKQTQIQIYQRLKPENNNGVPVLAIRQFGKLEKLVYRLEAEFGKHYSTLKETTNLVLTLLERVGKISGAVEKLQKTVKTSNEVLIVDNTSNLLDKTKHEDKDKNVAAVQDSQAVLPKFGLDIIHGTGAICEQKETSTGAISSIRTSTEENCITNEHGENYDTSKTAWKKLAAGLDDNKSGKSINFSFKENSLNAGNGSLPVASEKTNYQQKGEEVRSQKNKFEDAGFENACEIDKTLKVDCPEPNDKRISDQEDAAFEDQQTVLYNVLENSKNETAKDHIKFDRSNKSAASGQHDQKCVNSLNIEKQTSSRNHYSGNHCKDDLLPKVKNPSVFINNIEGKDNVTSITRLCKNEYGYKQKVSEMWSDNRVTFHGKESCFQGYEVNSHEALPTEPKHDPPNFPKKEGSSYRKSDLKMPSQKGRLQHLLQDSDFQYNDNGFVEPRNISEWLEYAEQLRINSNIRIKSGAVRRGRGHDSTVVLDCSEHMKGQKFNTMIDAAKQYVNGIKQVSISRGLEDNIALAVFGGNSRLILESTCDYDRILTQIDQLRPEGEAPVVGGLLMGLAGVLGGASSQIVDNDVQGHMIVFTDENSTNSTADMGSLMDNNPAYFLGDFRKHAEYGGVITQIASYSIKIYYIPIGKKINPIMEQAVRETHGKIIHISDMHRLIRMTQVLLLSAHIASELRYSHLNPSRDMIRHQIMQRSQNPEDTNEDCVDFVLEFINPLATDRRKGMFQELSCKTLYLGARVRRGPDWIYGDQDTGLAGTVVGRDDDHHIWVEWDSSHVNRYVYDEQRGIRTVIQVQEPRRLIDEMIAVGCRVTRGRNWRHGNDEDGGLGSFGTVLRVRQDGTAVVRWDCGKVANYQVGHNGLFEIQVSDDPHSYSTISFDMVGQFNDKLLKHEKKPVARNDTGFTTDSTNTENCDKTETFDNYVIPVNPKTTVRVSWEFKEEDQWKKFSTEITHRIEKAYLRKPSGKTIVQINKTTFVMYFDRMIKENTKTKEQCTIRRIE